MIVTHIIYSETIFFDFLEILYLHSHVLYYPLESSVWPLEGKHAVTYLYFSISSSKWSQD